MEGFTYPPSPAWGPAPAPDLAAHCADHLSAHPAPRVGLFPPASMAESAPFLSTDEVLALVRGRWQASYDLQLVRRQGRLYLQVMWGYLEQQSFPLSPEAYGARLAELVATLNGLGVAAQVRQWLATTRDRPRLGKALSLPLQLPEGRASEFLL